MLPFEPSPKRFKTHIEWLGFISKVSESRLLFQAKFAATIVSIAVLVCLLIVPANAQTDEFGDSAADPIKLFERGQGAHARGEFEKALDFYNQALKVRPEFPEAEFQKGNALVSLSRFDEAEVAFRQASQLKKAWSLPYSALGTLLMRRDRDTDAAQAFKQALAYDPQDNVALRMLSEIRLRAGEAKEALELARKATQQSDAPATAWVVLAKAEKATGNRDAAKQILERVVSEDSKNIAALLERADLAIDDKNYEAAITDLKVAAQLRPTDKAISSRLAFTYQQAGRTEEAAAVAKAAGLEVTTNSANDPKSVVGSPEEIEAANSEDPAVARPALEKLIEKNPRNPMLLARLGASFRKENPTRSLELYRRASELQPAAPEYAVGYAAALVQARRFLDAVTILRKVISIDPKNFSAHANLATALYEAKQYTEAVSEFEWLLATKPDLVVTHYFIATSHDYLGEYPEALASYEKFLARADAKTNQLEIEKVNLRLPTLRRQIQLGEGVKKNKKP